MRRRLLLDCDGILADFVSPCLEILSRHTGQEYQREQVTHWNIMEVLGIPKEVAADVYAEMTIPDFCARLPVFPGAVEGVKRLKDVVDVFIVTAPLDGPYWAWERERWLLRHFDIPPKCVVSTLSKFLIDGDFLVDDKTTTLLAWSECQPGFPIQWETLHNRDDSWTGASTRNWDELLRLVRDYRRPL